MSSEELIAQVTAHLRAEMALRALFLGGSHGNGTADAYSDLDFVAVVSRGAEVAFARTWRGTLETIEPIVLWKERASGARLINAITTSWIRCDLEMIAAPDLAKRQRGSLRAVVDQDELASTLSEAPSHTGPDPEQMSVLFGEFIRVLGLLAVVLGREEHLTAIGGVAHLRTHLIDLLAAESHTPHGGGALHLNRLLSDEQKALLAGMPVAEPNRASLIRAHLAYANAFLPRAKFMAGGWASPGQRRSRRRRGATWNESSVLICADADRATDTPWWEGLVQAKVDYSFSGTIALEELMWLFKQTDWAGGRTSDDVAALLRGSFVRLGARHEGKLIGFARAFTDGVYRAVVEDVIVDEGWRGRRIGNELVRRLIEHLAEVEEISLGCREELVPFYARLGFERDFLPRMRRTRPDESPSAATP